MTHSLLVPLSFPSVHKSLSFHAAPGNSFLFAPYKDALWYDVYEDEDDYVLKVKFDYLKHNTTAAFPAVVLVKDKGVEIRYEITSKNDSNVTRGVISIV